MTTKPKAKRFRIRRSAGMPDGTGGPAASAPEEALAPGPGSDGFGDAPFPTARPAEKPAPQPGQAPKAAERTNAAAETGATPAEEIDTIRKEGLTGRQLRMARRLAHKHGLAPASDFDAVRLLRRAGIDPFQRANMLQLVVADEENGTKPQRRAEDRVQLPQITDPEPGRELSTEVADPAETRAREIFEIQRDIARRRRRSLVTLALRLVAFVLLPTALAGYYYFAVATPMYATKSEFVIQQAEGNQGPGFGGLLSGTGLATSQDSITVQSYLKSREAMLRLDEDLGYKAHFASPEIDIVQRLDTDATNEQAYKLFTRNVQIGYDPTEGIVRMEVIAADPQVSAEFSRALIGYAEEQVDQLTQRLRADQMQGAREVFDQSEARMVAAQERVLELQERLGVLDPISENSALMTQISNFEIQLAEKRLELQQLLDNATPNAARVAGTEGDIARLQALIAELRSSQTESMNGTGSLAQVSSQLRMAEVDLETRTLMMQEALQSLEAARTEANRQVRYLSLGVNPVPPDEATYPRAFENTVLALLIFSGIYLMISLTVSILREQVSG